MLGEPKMEIDTCEGDAIVPDADPGTSELTKTHSTIRREDVEP
jgi:hypothetical protein